MTTTNKPHHVQFGDAARKQRPLKLALGANSAGQRGSREAGSNKIDSVNPSLEFLAVTEGGKKRNIKNILKLNRSVHKKCSIRIFRV